MYPILFEPRFYEKVWGGHRLLPFKGLEPDSRLIGESWEISAIEGNESVISNGEYKGLTITELVERFGSEVLGTEVVNIYGNRFPLLIKFIDAEQDLSIQVHPDDELAEKRHNSRGKTEMWYVMEAAKGASLYSGLKEHISKYEYTKRTEDGSICDVLQKYEVHSGDTFFIPAGRIHAIGAGILLAEIQESSDVTYRLYDYNRPGLDGKPRELHTELALEAIDYHVEDNYRTDYSDKKNKAVALAVSDFFVTKILSVTRPLHRNLRKYDSFAIYMCIEGSCEIETQNQSKDKSSISIHKGQTCLIPACEADIRIKPSGNAKLIEVYIDHYKFGWKGRLYRRIKPYMQAANRMGLVPPALWNMVKNWKDNYRK